MLQRLKKRKHVNRLALTPRAAAKLEILPENLLVGSASEILLRNWHSCGLFIVIGSVGAVTRLVAPLLESKDDDPAVVVIDAKGLNVVPLIGGHKRGAEDLAIVLAEELGGKSVITSNSNSQEYLPLDSFGDAWGWKRAGKKSDWHQLMLNQASQENLRVEQLSGTKLWMASKAAEKSLKVNKSNDSCQLKTLSIGPKKNHDCCWHPATLWIGIGCERNTSENLLERALVNALEDVCLAKEAVAGLVSIDLKVDEPALLAVAKRHDWTMRFLNVETLANVSVPNPSEVVKAAIGTPSVAEASALFMAGQNGSLLRQKHVYSALPDEMGGATIAIAESKKPFAPKRGELHLIGSGPGDLAYLTNDARFALARSAIWIGYKRYLDLLEPMRRFDQVRVDGELTLEIDRCKKALDLSIQGVRVALISSGDSGIYGMAGLALELWLDQPEDDRPIFNVHPGISAVQVAAARVGAPLMNDFCTISLSNKLTPWSVIKNRLKGALIGDFVIAIYNPKSLDRHWQLGDALKIIQEYREANTPVVLARQLGRSDEEVLIYNLKNLPQEKVDMLTILLIGNSKSLLKDGSFFTPRGYLSI